MIIELHGISIDYPDQLSYQIRVVYEVFNCFAYSYLVAKFLGDLICLSLAVRVYKLLMLNVLFKNQSEYFSAILLFQRSSSSLELKPFHLAFTKIVTTIYHSSSQ